MPGGFAAEDRDSEFVDRSPTSDLPLYEIEFRWPEASLTILVIEIEIGPLATRLERSALCFEGLRSESIHTHLHLHAAPALAGRDRLQPRGHVHHLGRGRRRRDMDRPAKNGFRK